MPTFDQLMQLTLLALEKRGGSGSIEEITAEAIEHLQLPEKQKISVCSFSVQLQRQSGFTGIYIDAKAPNNFSNFISA